MGTIQPSISSTTHRVPARPVVSTLSGHSPLPVVNYIIDDIGDLSRNLSDGFIKFCKIPDKFYRLIGFGLVK